MSGGALDLFGTRRFAERVSKLSVRMEGDALIVNCTVESEQNRAVDDVVWKLNGELINIFDHNSGLHDRKCRVSFCRSEYRTDYHINGRTYHYSLRVADATRKDDGIYSADQCAANNQDGVNVRFNAATKRVDIITIIITCLYVCINQKINL